MSRVTSTRFALFLSVAFSLSWLYFLFGLALLAGYEHPGADVSYSTRMTAEVLRRILSFASPGKMFEGLDWLEWLFILISPLAFVIALIAAKSGHTRLLLGVLASQCVLFLPSLLGVYALPFEVWSWIVGTADGEWLGERWPSIESIGVWWLGCVVLSVLAGMQLVAAGRLTLRSSGRPRCARPPLNS